MERWSSLLREARERAGASQQDLAQRAGTSRPTLSAYECGRKTPSVCTFERLLSAAGYQLAAVPAVVWVEVDMGRGRECWVPDRLWRLPVADALDDVVLPVELNWSDRHRVYRLRDRRQRARLYEVVLREGSPADIARYVDGALLIDAWDDLVLPRALRVAWWHLVQAELPGAAFAVSARAPVIAS
ncbi:MAG: helix-turn-helix domain-containing protein [Kineosporiaceae bacterium]